MINLRPMTPDEAQNIIFHESREGIAHSSRMGDFGTPERFQQIIAAINILHDKLRGRAEVNRELFAALFALGNQVEGNASGAFAKGLHVPDWLWGDGLALLNEALYKIFEDAES
jgi:hypothetical protein